MGDFYQSNILTQYHNNIYNNNNNNNNIWTYSLTLALLFVKLYNTLIPDLKAVIAECLLDLRGSFSIFFISSSVLDKRGVAPMQQEHSEAALGVFTRKGMIMV